MVPTPYPELNAVLQELVDGVRTALGNSFVAACLQGSFAVGDFDRHSDVDFIVAIEEELSDAHVHALQSMHERIYSLDCAWAQHLEGSYFPKGVLKDYSQRGKQLWYLDHGRALTGTVGSLQYGSRPVGGAGAWGRPGRAASGNVGGSGTRCGIAPGNHADHQRLGARDPG
jgi:predicted nucleotidyltransferase